MERDDFGKKAYKPRKYFNSHAHVERDSIVNLFFVFENISTHTLTWSVTDGVEIIVVNNEISTHTLTWSVTSSDSINANAHLFQLTRSRGA